MKIPFKTGYCVNCGAQAWVKSPQGFLVRPLEGTQAVWLALCDKDGTVGTRVGSLALCKDCNLENANVEDIIENLSASPKSGFTGAEFELLQFPVHRLELIQKFGEQ